MKSYNLYIIKYNNQAQQLVVLLNNFCVLDEHSIHPIQESFNKVFRVSIQLQDIEQFKQDLLQLSTEFEFDYCVLASEQILARPKLVVFDMDSTLIPIEVIDELALQAGVGAEVETITERAMQGELDFEQSFTQRLKLLQGMPESAVNAVKSKLSYNSGVKEFCHFLQGIDADICIASGGFVPFAQQLAQQINFSEIAANQLDFKHGLLTGNPVTPIVDAQYKAQMLNHWMLKRGLTNRQTVAIGDGANDLPMLQTAGLGVAYKAKPKVNLQADCVIRFGEMNDLISLFKLLYQ